MKRNFFLFCTLLMAFEINAQLPDGTAAPNFTATDTQGNQWNLYDLISSGNTVVLNFFGAWDAYAWNYHNSGELQLFNATYGPAGTGEVIVLNIEAEPSNSLAQLQGPFAYTADPATETQGDWLTGNTIPVIDNAAIADSFQVAFLPTMFLICPDGLVNEVYQVDASTLYAQVAGGSCPVLSQGLDPAILSAYIDRTCGNPGGDLTFKIKNLGTELVSALEIHVGGILNEINYSWNGSLNSNQSETVVIPNLQLINDDAIEIIITTENVNQLNDTVVVVNNVGLSTLHVQLELGLDNYPDEVTWEIRNSLDEIIHSDGDFDIPYQYFNSVYELPVADCYSFYLYDTEGDGLHGGQWGGYDGTCYLRSLDDDGVVTSVLLSYDGSYNFSSTLHTPSFLKIDFEAGSPLGVEESVEQSQVLFFPNPSSGMLNLQLDMETNSGVRLEIFDLTGATVYSGVMGNVSSGLQTRSFDLSFLDNGIYFGSVTYQDKTYVKSIVISR